ncbi:hypothetical protein GCM10011350_04760 [Marinomonas arctica]|nr:hypothetical protein GCM10011350_04760 [Marinomonas arctica]
MNLAPRNIDPITIPIPITCPVVKTSPKTNKPINAALTGINPVNNPAMLAGTSDIPLYQNKNDNTLAVIE